MEGRTKSVHAATACHNQHEALRFLSLDFDTYHILNHIVKNKNVNRIDTVTHLDDYFIVR